MSDNSTLLTVREASEIAHTSPATLRYWRHAGSGPRSFKIGRRVMYKRADVEQWLQQQYDTTSVGGLAGGQA